MQWSLKGEVEIRELLLEVRDERNGGLLTGYTNFRGSIKPGSFLLLAHRREVLRKLDTVFLADAVTFAKSAVYFEYELRRFSRG